MRILVLTVGILVLLLPLSAQINRNNAITAEELRYHLRYLASDELEGRRTGFPGADKAAQYIAKEFESYGLAPKGGNGSYFQDFDVIAGMTLGKKNSLVLSGDGKITFVLDKDFRPLGFSANGEIHGGVVFAGYGIVAASKEYDDYAGLAVKGKVVMVLRYHPEGDNQHSEFNEYAGLRYKATKAREQGALGLIVVTGPADTDKDDLAKLAYDQSGGDAGLPAFSVTQEAANRLLSSTGSTIKDLQNQINTAKKPRSMELNGVRLDGSAEVLQIHKTGKNVVGFLRGSGPLAEEVLVIGAHYDHLGMGGEGSGSLQPDTVAIHNGADDNGSGAVGLLELAQYFCSRRSSIKRSMLFISFSGEEMGLLGSAYFVNNPTIPLEKMVAMLNMDMIGRLHDRKLIVYGIGTAPTFEALALKYNADSAFVLKLNKDGFGPSDQSSFYGKNMPVFHFFTDLHSDYHRPSDDWDKINYDGEKDVLEYVSKIATELDQTVERPQYVKVEQPQQPAGTGRGNRSYTGTIPDFGETVEGMKISGVREGSPAEKAGLTGGDTIVKFGTIVIKNLYDYTFALGEYKPGDEVDVTVKRGTETITMKLTVGKRN